MAGRRLRPEWEIYLAALTTALSGDEAEREGAARLVRELGEELLPAGRQWREPTSNGTGMGSLIREVLEERLRR